MAILMNKRFSKLAKLTIAILIITTVCIVAPNYLSNKDSSLSASDFMSGLQSSIDSYTYKDNEATIAADLDLRKTKLQSFYNSVFQNLIDFSPKGKCKRVYKDTCKLNGDVGNRPDDYESWIKLSYNELLDCLSLSTDDLENLSTSHTTFVEQLNNLVLPKNSYKGSGIVTVGGGKFSLMSFLVIKTLRNLGTTLPVEVFIPPNDEGETEFCNTLLPKYNAKCIYISDILPKEMIENFEFKGYQFKSIAIVASSFENMLLLDADNFPIKPLNNIFEQEPYKSTGLVMWPDFWRRTTQPQYYDIAGVSINIMNRVRNSIDDLTPPEAYTENLNDLRKDVPFHDLAGTIPDVSTESGQLLINKSKHLGTVLLALYYNVNGPNWYYPIFSQKAAGEGDKETFIAAANFYNLPFYQVKTNVGVDGYHQSDNKGFRGVAMLQHDFVQDFERYYKAKKNIEEKYSKVSKITLDPKYSVEKFYQKYFDGDTTEEADVMFIHSNLPKFDPLTLWKGNDLIVDGKHIRSFTNLAKLQNYDIELENFKVFNELLCIDRVPMFRYLEDELSPPGWQSMCRYVADRLQFLDESHAAATGTQQIV